MKVTSREYKVMLDHRMFVETKPAIAEFWTDLCRVAENSGVKVDGAFSGKVRQKLFFLDTDDHTLRQNRLLFRVRQPEIPHGPQELTLKCRSEDRYLAAGMDTRIVKQFKGKAKLEEDIGAPFCSRFSRSVTIKNSGSELPATIGEAGRLFPAVRNVLCNGSSCDRETQLTVVNKFIAHERVLKGPTFSISTGATASVALILWSHAWRGRVIAAECSSRYGDEKERYSAEGAAVGFELFLAIQSLDWCLPGAKTKTQIAFEGV